MAHRNGEPGAASRWKTGVGAHLTTSLGGATAGILLTSLEFLVIRQRTPAAHFWFDPAKCGLATALAAAVGALAALMVRGRGFRAGLLIGLALLEIGHLAIWGSRTIIIYLNRPSHLNSFSIGWGILCLATLVLVCRLARIGRPMTISAAGLVCLAVALPTTLGISHWHRDNVIFRHSYRQQYPAVDHQLTQRSAPPGARNILLIVADTLRADALGCYGNRNIETPAVDRLAARGLRFADVTSVSNWTAPTMATVLTGLRPREHRKIEFFSLLDEEVVTLAEYFQSAGYHTGAVQTNPILKSYFGFAQGFDYYNEREKSVEASWWLTGTTWSRLLGLNRAPATRKADTAEIAVDKMLAWLTQQPAETPFFAYLHLMDPHAPYTPPEPYRSRYVDGEVPDFSFLNDQSDLPLTADRENLDEYRRLYLAEVAYLDSQVGRLLEEMQARNLLADTVVVFTADHGEQLREHGGLLHGYTLFREEIRVPLIVVGPEIAGGQTIDRPRSLRQLSAALFDLAGLVKPPHLAQNGWQRLTATDAIPLFVEVDANMHGNRVEQLAVRDGDFKLIVDRRRNRTYLFNLRQDKGEKNNLAGKEVAAQASLEGLLASFEEKYPRFAEPPLDEQSNRATEAALRSLGYIR